MTRPPIPEPVKRAVVWLNMANNKGYLLCAETGKGLNEWDLLGKRVHFDHNPPLALRRRVGAPDLFPSLDDYNKEPSTYHPNANDPAYIDVVSIEGHNIRTNQKRGLYLSDASRIAKQRRREKPPKAKRKWPSRKIESRPFPKRATP